MPKSILASLLTACCALGMLLAPATWAAEPQLTILASTFPIYQITRNIAQGVKGAEVRLMLPAQLGCPHDYALTPQDMTKLTQAQVLVINGLGMESFLDTPALTGNTALRIIDSSKGIPPELLLHQKDDGHGHDGHHHHDHGDLNPHLFASPRMAARLADHIARELARLQPENSAPYLANGAAYSQRLNQLADTFTALGKRLRNPRIVTQHGIFDYLARDAGLDVVAVVQAHDGLNPSAAEIMGLVAAIKRRQAGALFTEPQYPEALGRTIAKEAGIASARLDPVANGPIQAPLDYYEHTMAGNLTILEQTLGSR